MDKKVIPQFTFRAKLLMIQICIVLIVSCSIGAVFYNIFSDFVKNKSLEDAKINYRVLTLLLDNQREQLVKSGEVILSNNNLSNLIKRKRTDQLNDLLVKSGNDNTNVLMIVDSNGYVLANANGSREINYKLSIDSAVKKAVKSNEIVHSFEILNKQDLLRQNKNLYDQVKMNRIPTKGSKAGYINKTVEEDALMNTVVMPVKSNNNVIGAIVAGTVLNRNFTIVDKAKNNVEGIDFTIFQNDHRVSTTVSKANGRATGTLLSEKVVNEVLVNGKDYVGKAMVAGIPYMSFYTPIKNAEDKTVGLLFAAVSVKKVNDTIVHKFGYGFAAVLAVLFIIFVPVSFYITKKLMAPLQSLTVASEKMADGDLSFEVTRIETNDELGNLSESFIKMSENMKTLIKDIKAKSEDVFSSSCELQQISDTSTQAGDQIASAIEQIAVGTQDQARQVNDSFQDISEIASATSHILKEVRNITDAVNNSVESAEKGQYDVQNTIQKITEIRETTNQIAEQMQTLGNLGIEIGKIVDFITSIANQTNLLALNAAIESARAGEHGKGFAVVAEEVKKLAEESGSAASQIKEMIEQIQQESFRSVENTKSGVALVNEGFESVAKLQKVLEGILTDSKASEQKAEDVLKSVTNLNKKNETVSCVMENISAVSQESAASTEEVTASITEQHNSMGHLSERASMLAELTQDLNSSLSKFTI